ncbi:MAG: hypothetical protein WCV72_03285 [Patescibacteria group bacterium]
MNSKLESLTELLQSTCDFGVSENKKLINARLDQLLARFDVYRDTVSAMALHDPQGAQTLLENIIAIEAGLRQFAEEVIRQNTAKIRNILL